MTGLYAQLQTTAAGLIKQFGKSATVTRLTTGGDPWDPTSGPPQTFTVNMVESDAFKLSNLPNSFAQVGDKVGIIAVGGDEPKLGDRITIGGVQYGFVSLSALEPGGVVLIYQFVARK